MLRIREGRLVWNSPDELVMQKVLGAQSAAKGFAPVTPTTLRVAKQYGVALSPRAESTLENAIILRHTAKLLKKLPDVAPIVKRARRAWTHQRVALNYMAALDLPAYLIADEPGVGKTLVAILWARYVLKAKRILVIAPNGAKAQWADEIRRYCGEDETITLVGGTKAAQTKAAQTPSGWVIGHWESLVHARAGYLKKAWDVIIADEAHYANNRTALRTKTLLKLKSAHRVALTAHPYTNQPDEIYAILQWLYPTQYTSFWRFFEQHVKFRAKYFGGFEIEGLRRPKLWAWELGAFTIRRRRREVYKTLPPITRVPRTVDLTTKGRREYDRLRRELFVELEAHKGESKILRIPTVLARITRLRQYLVDPGLLGAREPSVKYPEVLNILRDVQQPAVIFTMFREAAERLKLFLAKHKLRVGLLHGGVKVHTGDRHRVKGRFLAGDFDALIVTVKAGGQSLNLGKYGLGIFLDLPWHPRDLEQVEGRVDRPEEGTGKLVPTTFYRILVADSYEQKLEQKKLRNKHRMFTEGFSATDLEELFNK